MRRSFKYRIYPSKAQREALDIAFDFNKFLYNSALNRKIAYYKLFGKALSYNELSSNLPYIKAFFEKECSYIYSQTLQATLRQLEDAFSGFFKRIKSKSGKAGFPRYKRANSFNSLMFPQSDFNKGGVKLLDNQKRIRVFGIGDIKIEYHRDFLGDCKTVQIKKEGTEYHVILSCANVPKALLPKTGKTVGIDLGLNNFITMDDGTFFRHPKPWRTAKEKLAYKSRQLSAKQKDSNNRKKALVALQRAHVKVANIRNDFQHKLANDIIKNNDVIVIEKLNVKNMLEAKGFEVNKNNISDASWSNFVALLTYKAESAGKSIIEVNPCNTSKMCCNCGNIKHNLTLKDRIYTCFKCKFVTNRDVNAAINIKNKGLGTSPANSKMFSEAPNL